MLGRTPPHRQPANGPVLSLEDSVTGDGGHPGHGLRRAAALAHSVADTTEAIVFYNEPAERILGVRFEETGRIDREEADRLIELSEDPGAGPEDSERPLEVALQQRRPAHARRWLLRRADRVRLQVELTAFPIIDHDERLLGAVAMFWERHGP